MSANKYKPHLNVLCEDEINQDIMRGFLLGYQSYDFSIPSKINIIPTVAGGWSNVVGSFESHWKDYLAKHQNAYLLMLIDFDENIERIDEIKQKIPQELKDRVFILGCFDEPEDLKSDAHQAMSKHRFSVNNESIGKVLFLECKDDKLELWQSEHLKHNLQEIERLKQACHFIDWDFA